MSFIVSSILSVWILNAAPMQLGNPNAPQGGTLYLALDSEPEKLNPLTSTDYYSSQVQEWVMEGLMMTNPETYKQEPLLAEKYEISKDGLTFTFHLRKNLKWSDGKPLTAKDLKFTYETVMNKDYDTAHMRSYFENVKSVDLIDENTIRFVFIKKYYKNLETVTSAGFLPVMPQHIYGDLKNKNSKVMVGSGPYFIKEYNRGKSIILARNPHWWGKELFKGQNNFDRIYFRFIKEKELQLERAKKGDLDIIEITAEIFTKKTDGKPFGETIFKKKIENDKPKSFGYLGWNLKNKIFEDRNVRIALAHLMNRELMIKKFRSDMSVPALSTAFYKSPSSPPGLKPFEFSPKKAAALLAQAGWKDTDKDGLLDKEIDGVRTPFKFTLIYGNRDNEKYYTLYKEDLAKAGIQMDLSILEFNALVKSIHERKFEAYALGWALGSLEPDLKQLWHSASAQEGGSNYVGYSNPKVDDLIDKARVEMNQPKRMKMWQEANRLIAEDAPIAFMFNDKYEFYVVNKKLKSAKETMRYDLGISYWWIEE